MAPRNCASAARSISSGSSRWDRPSSFVACLCLAKARLPDDKKRSSVPQSLPFFPPALFDHLLQFRDAMPHLPLLLRNLEEIADDHQPADAVHVRRSEEHTSELQ